MPNALKPANFIVTHGNDFFDILIRTFTMSTWNHAALILNEAGDIIELTNKGIERNNISKYATKDRFIVEVDLSDEDRAQVIAYANFMLGKHDSYGFLTIATIAFKIITKSRLVVKLDGTLICSEFVARALAEGGVIWEKDPSLITPADLYNYYKDKGTFFKKND